MHDVRGARRVTVLLMAAAVALVLAPASVAGEMLHVDVACPAALPREVCFGAQHGGRGAGAGAGARWDGVELALAQVRGYVQTLLQTAIEVEHSTIPLYLTTGYSIVDQGSFAAKTLKGVVMEEMLHMVNAANVLNAIGGAPLIDSPSFIPKYPLVLPFLNITADIVWFTQTSIQHYQTLESTPPGGYNASISAAYLHIIDVLAALCEQHGEAAVFSGDPALQVAAATSNGQSAPKVTSLRGATAALIGVADQGGGCPVKGSVWPKIVNISAGPLGGNVSHAARFEEIVKGRSYRMNDTVGTPTGALRDIDWVNVRRFAPNPSTDDFKIEQCVDGGSWVVRNASFFVKTMWEDHNRTLSTSNQSSWEDCAKKCETWTIKYNRPMAPCAMWTWLAEEHAESGIAAHSCLLAQGGGPLTALQLGFISGCQFGTVCNRSLPGPVLHHTRPSPPPPALALQCAEVRARQLAFAGNYTALLVQLHNVFNGKPDSLMQTIGLMYALKSQAIALMETPDPRIDAKTMGVGPSWTYIASASQFESRGGRARPI